MTGSAASYNFNSFQEIKSHSSILFNERMAILFYLLDMKNLNMHRLKSVDAAYDTFSILKQIYKNIRTLIRFNDTMRVSMNLETKDPGIYTTDVAMTTIEKMLTFCEENGFTVNKVNTIINEIDNVEMVIKDILQYFHYFIRPDFSQKPDVEIATEKYKEMADAYTVEQLKQIVGKRNHVDFDSLGTERIKIETDKVEYDPLVDGDLSEYEDADEDLYIDDDETDDNKDFLSED